MRASSVAEKDHSFLYCPDCAADTAVLGSGIPAHPEAAHTRAWTVGFWALLAFLAAYLLGLCAYVLDWMLGTSRSAWIDAYIRVTCIGFAVAMLIATVILPWSR